MYPQPLGPAEWTQVEQASIYLLLFVALAINTAFALLLGWAILPSLVSTADTTADTLALRRVLLPLGLVSAALMLWALWRGLALAVDVASRIYPRLAI